jgi:hypothetical protein
MKFKTAILIFFSIVCTGFSFSQIKLTENFNYPLGDTIGAHGWIWNSGTLNTLTVTSPGLTYPGYPFSGIGNAVTLNNNGNDQYKPLSSADSTGSVYAAFLVRIDSAKAPGDYFLAFLPNNSTALYEGRVNARFRNGSLNFGITKANVGSDTSVSGIWTTGSYFFGVTYLLILKYTFIPAGTTNDNVSLFVFASGLPLVEPAPSVGPITYSSPDAQNIGRIALRQGTANRAANLVVDGIRVASSWKSITDSVAISALYAFGSIPENFGCPDTLGIRLDKTVGGFYDINLSIKVQDIDSPFVVRDSVIINVSNFSMFDTLINYEIPCQIVTEFPTASRPERLIVEALPGTRSPYVFDRKEYCQYITYDAYNYVDSCLPLDASTGINNSSGNIVARFNNNSSQAFPIGSIVHSFTNNFVNGNQPYKIVIFGDDGNNKPGTLFFISSTLTSPPGTAYVTYTLPAPLFIAPFSRFYVGIRQTSTTNIGMSAQNEFPVRSKSFFYSSPDTSNTWTDFSDAGINSRLYISPRKNADLKATLFIEGFYNAFLNTMTRDTVRAYLRNSSYPYSQVDSSKSFISIVGAGDFYFSHAIPFTNYYLEVKQRNSIETWSNSTVLFSLSTITYNFSSAASQAYGNNMKQVDSSPLRFAIYSGDVNQDGNIDLADASLIDNDLFNFAIGYIPADVDGNNIVDINDASIVDNNSFFFISKIVPP